MRIYDRFKFFQILAIGLFLGVGLPGEAATPGAHVHGEGEINIAVEGTRAKVELRAPSESIYGFEHEAKTAAEKKKRAAAMEILETRMHQMVVFDPGLGCKFSKAKVVEKKEEHHGKEKQHTQKRDKHGHSHDHKHSAEHREVHAEYDVNCQKPLAGSVVRFAVTKSFPNLEKVRVQGLSEKKQSGVEIVKDRGSLQL